jgi:hypothetical protein
LYASAANQDDLSLDHSRLFQNNALGGGGIYFDASTHQTNLTIKDGLVSFNQAFNSTNNRFNGGGIFITVGELLVSGESTISSNTVSSNSGFAVVDCLPVTRWSTWWAAQPVVTMACEKTTPDFRAAPCIWMAV